MGRLYYIPGVGKNFLWQHRKKLAMEGKIDEF